MSSSSTRRNGRLGRRRPEYMSLRNGKHWIKRQAVRFRIFCYSSDGSEIGELTEEIMGRLGISATWTASVANRKLNVWSRKDGRRPLKRWPPPPPVRLSDWRAIVPGTRARWSGLVISRETASWAPQKEGCIGRPRTTVFHPTVRTESDNDVLDTTSDGSISVSLSGAGDLPAGPRLRHRRSAGPLPRCGPRTSQPSGERRQSQQGFCQKNEGASWYSRRYRSRRCGIRDGYRDEDHH